MYIQILFITKYRKYIIEILKKNLLLQSQWQSVKHFLIFLIIPIPDFFLNFMWKLLITPDFQLFTLKKIMLK